MVHWSSATFTFRSVWIVGKAMVTAERLARSRNIAVHLHVSLSVSMEEVSALERAGAERTLRLGCNRDSFGAACRAMTGLWTLDGLAWCCYANFSMYAMGFRGILVMNDISA